MASSDLSEVERPNVVSDHDDQSSTKTENKITFMDSEIYRAAAEGKTDKFKEPGNEKKLDQLTPNKNTILHIHITASKNDETFFVEEILKLRQELLLQANGKGEIPLHIAARYGHAKIVKFLIQSVKHDHNDLESGIDACKKMLRTTNIEKDTPLHEAVRFKHLHVVSLLTMEDSDFLHSANEGGETPLYMAAERGYREVVREILDNCSSPATSGPSGRTVLHAATIVKDAEMTGKILKELKNQDLTKQPDEEGWIPLHHAAYWNNLEAVKLLLEADNYTAYLSNKNGITALHIAASKGYDNIMREILSWSPDCSELVDKKGWNVLHFAVEGENHIDAVKVILEDDSLSNLINEKDVDGNTPFLHISTSLNDCSRLDDDSRVDKKAFNTENQNALDIVSANKKFRLFKTCCLKLRLHKNGLRLCRRIQNRKARNEDDVEENSFLSRIYKAKESTLLAATLIATVTFAAGFTLPGGYMNDGGQLQGTALLRKNVAFQVFMITDTLAMVLSTAAVFINLFLIMQGNCSRILQYYMSSFLLTTLAMGGMVLAFVTGTCAVLAHSTALATATCVIGSSFFIFFYFIYKKAIYTNEFTQVLE